MNQGQGKILISILLICSVLISPKDFIAQAFAFFVGIDYKYKTNSGVHSLEVMKNIFYREHAFQ